MITEGEFVLIKTLERHHGAAIDDAQTIINRKNRELIRMRAALEATQRELAVERGKRKLAELQLRRRH